MQTERNQLGQAVDRRLSSLRVPDDLAEHIVRQVHGPAHARTIRLRRPLAVAAVLCVMLVCSMGVVAATQPTLQNLFSVLGTKMSAMLQPIERSASNNGIDMEVLGAMNDNDMAIVYVSVRDTKGGRIDSRTTLSNISLSGMVTHPVVQRIAYDANTNTALFRIEGVCGEDLDGKKVTLSVGNILLGEKEWYNADTGFSVSDISAGFPSPVFSQRSDVVSYSTSYSADDSSSQEWDIFDGFMLLEPAEPGPLADAFPFGTVTAAGVRDNVLHIQLRFSELGKYAQIYGLSLAGEDGQPLPLTTGTADFGAETQVGKERYCEYAEYLMSMPPDTPTEELRLVWSGVTYEGLIPGSWNTTFQLDSATRQKVSTEKLNVDGWRITRVELSPMGITITGQGSSSAMPEATAYDFKGDPIPSNGSSVRFEGDTCVAKSMFETPIPIEEISRVMIGDVEVTFK